MKGLSIRKVVLIGFRIPILAEVRQVMAGKMTRDVFGVRQVREVARTVVSIGTYNCLERGDGISTSSLVRISMIF